MQTHSVDALGQLFESIEVSSTALNICNLRHPWGIAFPGANATYLHAVTHGEMRVEYADGSVFELRAGDVLLSSRLMPGAMMSRPGVTLIGLEQLWSERGFTRWAEQRSTPSPNVLTFGGRGSRTLMIGVMFGVGEPWRTNLLSKLPPHIHLKRSENVLAPWLATALKAISQENLRQPLGYGPIAQRIGEIVLFSCIRSYLLRASDDERNWFSALTDRRLAKVITVMRTDPNRGWTLRSLAREAGMSRSTFASRFHDVVAMSPMKYLRNLQMTQAASDLAAGQISVKEAARRTGYASPSAFSIAFKRRFGASPQRYTVHQEPVAEHRKGFSA